MKLIKLTSYNTAIMCNDSFSTDSYDEALAWLDDLENKVRDGVANAHSGAFNYVTIVKIGDVKHKISHKNHRRNFDSIREAREILEAARSEN